MMVLTATGVVDERGPSTYSVNPVSRTLLDDAWANGHKHLYVHIQASAIDQVCSLLTFG